nr:hypothetical protein [Rhodococcus sp. (in: high G+C Gram-positive bacteria)]
MPGPAPKNPEDRIRRNSDPLTDANGWTEIDPSPNDGAIPPIPPWSSQDPIVGGIYAELGKLPQARLWGPGTWFEIHLTLPIMEKYLEKPSSEAFKTILAAWGSGLRLTEDDMQRARIRVRKELSAEEQELAIKGNPKVASINRRERLLQQQDLKRGIEPQRPTDAP